MVCMANTATVTRFMKMLEDEGCECLFDKDAGTAEAKDEGKIVYKALQKGKGGSWMVRCTDTECIKFS